MLFPWVNVETYNLGQKFVDKLTKLRKIDFSMECFTANIWLFSSAYVKIYPLTGRLGTRNQTKVFQGFSWNYLISLIFFFFLCGLLARPSANIPWFLSCSATSEATRKFIFWWLQFTSVSFVVKRNFAKTWKSLQKFCPRLHVSCKVENLRGISISNVEVSEVISIQKFRPSYLSNVSKNSLLQNWLTIKLVIIMVPKIISIK